VRAGHVAYGIYFIYSGSVSVLLGSSKEQEMITLNKGQVFGVRRGDIILE